MRNSVPVETAFARATWSAQSHSTWLLCFLFLCLLLSPAVQAQFTYYKENDTIVIAGYTGPGGDLTIPATLEGLPVARIETFAFVGHTELTRVTIPDSVTSISGWAFSRCSGLTNVSFPKGITAIQGGVFSECTGLVSVVIPESVTSIGDDAFVGCSGLTNLVIPDAVHYLGSDAFAWCTGLTNINISKGLTTLGTGVFSGCTGLTGVTIPNGVTYIANDAFSECAGLTGLNIPNSVEAIDPHAFFNCTRLVTVSLGTGLSHLDTTAFAGCSGLTSITVTEGNPFFSSLEGVLFDGQKSKLLQYPPAKADPAYSIPAGVTSVGDFAFVGCGKLTALTIPNGVSTIGYDAFGSCTGLSSLTIPDSVTTIDRYAFGGCSGLTSLSMGNRVNSLKEGVFANCTGLITVALPYGITNIGYNAFVNCTRLVGIALPDSVKSIDEYAFSGCAGLTDISFGNSVTTFKDGAFAGCAALKSITIPDTITSLGDFLFSGCSGLTSFSLGNNGVAISGSMFGGCTHLSMFTVDHDNPAYASVEGVLFNKELTRLIKYPAGKPGTEYAIPGGVTVSGEGAFASCAGLTSLTIPASLTSMGDDGLAGCTGLTQVIVNGGNPAYASVDGVLVSTDKTQLLHYPARKAGAAYVIPSTVTYIVRDAFIGCTQLSHLTIPSSARSLDYYVFGSCTALTGFTVDDHNPAFAAVDGVLFDKTLTQLFQYPLGRTAAAYTIPDGVTYLINRAFAGCTGLTEVTVPPSVRTLGSEVFDGCTALTRVIFKSYPPDLPGFGATVFNNAPATIYYLPAFEWPDTFSGRPTVALSPRIVTDHGKFGLRGGQLGFTLSGRAGMSVVVEACDNLAAPNWLPVSTNTFNAQGSAQFIDPAPANKAGRFYRFRTQ